MISLLVNKAQPHYFSFLFLSQLRRFIKDTRAWFFVFIFPIVYMVVIGTLFLNKSPMGFIGLSLMPLLTINMSLLSYQCIEWRQSVLVKRIKMLGMRLYHMILSFLFFHLLVSLLGWLLLFGVISTYLGAIHNTWIFHQIHWGWQLLVILLTFLLSFPLGVAVGLTFATVEAAQFFFSTILNLILLLSGAIFPISLLVSGDSLGSRFLEYLTFFNFLRFTVTLAYLSWNGGALPNNVDPQQKPYHDDLLTLPVIFLAVTVFLVVFWCGAIFLVTQQKKVLHV